MEDELILSEKDRSKLDGIVNQMIKNNEPDENIRFVVNDFKGKYGVKKKESSEASSSKPSEKPSAPATSPKAQQPSVSTQPGAPKPISGGEPIQPTFRTEAPSLLSGAPVAKPKPAEQPKDQLSVAAKAQAKARISRGEVEEAPAKKPVTEEAAPRTSSYLQAVEKDEFARINKVRSAVRDAESTLKEKNIDKSLSESFDLGWGGKPETKTEDSDAVQDARKKANEEINQYLGVKFDIFVPNEQGILVEEPEKKKVVVDYLDKANQYEQYSKAQDTLDEAKRRQQQDPNAFPLTSQLLNTVPESIGLATGALFDIVGIGETGDYSEEVRAKRMARRVALGLEDGKGIKENLQEGNVGDAMKELMLAGADFVPQMAAFVVNPYVGYAYNAASAGGSTYDQFRDRNDLSKGDKATLALISAVADYALNRLTMGAENSIRASIGIAANEVGTEVAKKKALDYLNPLKNEIIGKGFLGEAAEEGGVNLITQIAAGIIAGDEFDVNSLIDETLIGGVFGAGTVALPKVLARGANGFANASMVSEFRKVTDQIKEINDALINEELTPSQAELLTKQLEKLSARQNEMSNASEQLYSVMSFEDAKAIYDAHQQINEGLKTYNEAENDVVKKAAFEQVREALTLKRNLENKYAEQVKEKQDDRKEETGVPSPVVEGEAVVEAQPIEGAGQETTETSGVLQVPVEEGNQVAETAVVTPVVDFVDRRVSYTTPSGVAVEGFLYDEGSGKLVVEDDQGNKYDIGNVEEIGGLDAAEFNVAQATTEDFDVNNNGNFVIRGQEYVNNYSNPEAAIQRDADGNVLSVTLETKKGAKRTFRGPLAETIAYNITMAQTAETINEVETTIERPVSTVIAAPFFNTTVASIEEARNLRNTPEYKQQQDIIKREAALTGVEIVSIDESIGGFENSKGEKIVEVSNIIRVRGDKRNIDEFAAMMGSMSVETQEATIAADYVKSGSENHNADELTFVVGNIDGAIKALKTQGFYDFTINDSESTITILDFSLGEDVEFKERIGNLAIQLRLQNINYEAKDRRALDSRYIGPETRTGILGQLQEDSVQRGQAGTELRNEVSEAIRRNEEIISFLSGEQVAEPVAPMEVTSEEQVTEEPVAEATPQEEEVVAVDAVAPEKGKSLDDIYDSYKESIKPKISPKTILEGAKKQLFDRQSKIKRAVLDLGLRTAYDRIVNKAGASARANDKYRRAEKKIYSGLSSKDIETLDKIIFARRVIQVDKNFDERGEKRPKHPLGYKSENAKYELEQLKKKLGDEKYNDLIKRSDDYFSEFRSTLKDLYDAGLISNETYESLRTNDYQPRKFIEHVFDFENSEFLVKDFGLSQEQIKAIGEGSEKDLIMSSRFLLGSYLLSASKRIFTNRANVAVSEAIGKDGANDWVRSLDEDAKPDGGFTKVYFFENGERKAYQLRSDLKRELDNMSSLSSVDGKVGKFFSMISGTPVIKLMATRANPLFAFKNFPRDLGHILFFTNIYDKHNLYYATYLVLRDFARGLKSSIQDTQDFKDYMDLGGGMDFISIQGRDGNFVSRNAINKTIEGIGKLGEWSEVGFRIGVYKRFKDDGIADFEKKNGVKPEGEDLLRIKERAVAKSREIIDFSQGGEAIKAVDKFVPYLNAAFQGFRVGATYIANNPKKFASKFVQAQMGLLALSFYNAFIGDEDDLEDIPEHTRLMNFIILLPGTRVDEDGKKRRKYILIPKTQQAAPFFALMDVSNRKILNDVFGKEYKISEDEYSYIINGMRKGLPIGDDDPMKEIASLIPTINAAFTYKANYDTFRDRMISMDMGDVIPAYEGVNDPNVEQFYKVIGEVAGVSPIRTKVATEKLITGPNSSFIVGMSYGILDAIANQYPLDRGSYDIKIAEKETKSLAEKTGLNFKKAFVRETDPSWNLYNQKETLDNIDMEAGTERARLRAKAKELAKGTNNQEQLDKSIEEAIKIADEIAKKNPVDAKFFIESFKSNIGESPASQQAVEIQYSASDKARAEKIKMLYNPQTKDDFMMIMRDVYQQTGYKISPKTIYEYQQAYGELK